MRRGEVWTVAGSGAYTGKPRPAVVIQDDAFDATDSVTICAFTTDPTDAPLFRVLVEPTETNGLAERCRMMVDKITTVPRSRLGARIGELREDDLQRLGRALILFLGLAGSTGRSSAEAN